MSTELSTNTTPARGLALATFDDAFRFASMVAKSDFAPKDFKGKPESCLLAIQHGAEIGLSPMQSLQNIACINGRPAIWGDAALAVVMASAVCEYVREHLEGDGDAAVAICEAKRRGYEKPTVSRFSMQDAKRAGLAGKSGPWTQYPRRMLQLRARGFALRDAFPDVLKGLVTAEEAQDYPVTPPRSVDAGSGITVHHVASFEPPAPTKVATEEDMQKARLAISRAKTTEKLVEIGSKVHERTDAGFYTSSQASELTDLVDTRIELLAHDSERDFPIEAAEHEVHS